MAAITILSRDIVSGGGITPDIWRFHVSPLDAANVMADHLSFTLYTAALSGPYHPSLVSSPWSELYNTATSDPYPLTWGVVDNGGGDWSINFIKETGNTKFGVFSFSSWTGFDAPAGATGGTGSIPTYGPDLRTLKSRSPYLYITPDLMTGSCSIYVLTAGSQSSNFGYTNCSTGEQVVQTVPAFTNQLSTCLLDGSLVSYTTGATYSFDDTCSAGFIYDTAYFKIKAWNGDFNIQPTALSYYKIKQKVTPLQTNIYINLSNLLREGLEGDVKNYVIANNPTQSQPIGIKESKWSYINTQFSAAGLTVSNTYQNDYFYVLDGYTEPGEKQGLWIPYSPLQEQKVLLSDYIDNLGSHFYSRSYTFGAQARIHFMLEGLQSIVVTPTTGPSYSIAFSGTSSISNEYIQSILVDTTQNMTYQFNYTSPTSTWIVKTFIESQDCKYENFNVIFKNKWGILETVSMSKKSNKTLSIDDSEYLRGIVDFNGSFDVSRHTQKHFNTNMTEEWTLNTDFIPEYMNVSLRELMASEEIWLYSNYKIIPVNKSDTSFAVKTSLNDKLIQYTMKVKLSHNSINNIQ
jgi:hypothetical protein